MVRMIKYPKQIVAIAAFVIAWLLVIAGPNNIQNAPDYQSLHLIHKVFLNASIAAGEMPFWNPYQMLGRPFLADPETAIFYPTTLLYLFLPFSIALLFTVFIHLFIAGNYTIELARKLEIHPSLHCIAAIFFMLNGTLVMRLMLGQIPPFIAISITPWLLWATLRVMEEPKKTNLFKLILPLTLSFLAGHTQFYWIHIIGLTLFVIGYQLQKIEFHYLATTGKALASLYICVLVSLCLSGVQLIPSIEFFFHSHRNTESILSLSQSFSLTGLASLTLPTYSRNIFWNQYFFPGTLLFTLTLLSPHALKNHISRALLFVTLGSIILALGPYSPLFETWNALLPGYKLFRGPARIALWIVPVFVLLGIRTLSCIFTGTYKRNDRQLIPALILTMIPFTIAPLVFKDNYPWMFELLVQGISLVLLVVLILGLLNRKVIQHIVICISLVLLAKQFFLTVDAKDYFSLPPRIQWEEEMRSKMEALASDQPQPKRIAAPETRIRANTATRYKIANLNCFAGMHLERTWKSLHLGVEQEPTRARINQPANNVFSREIFPEVFAVDAVFTPERGWILKRERPKFAHISHAHLTPESPEALSQYLRDGHPQLQIPLTESKLPLPTLPTDAAPVGKAIITDYQTNRVVVSASTSHSAILFLSDAWYPGWTVRRDGQKSKAIPVNLWMRGALIPPGQHTLVFEFIPISFYLGLGLSLLTLISSLFWQKSWPMLKDAEKCKP